MRVLMLVCAPLWLGPPRLLRALSDAGCETATLSPAGSMIELSRFGAARFRLRNDATLQTDDLVQALAEFRPDRLLPGDELAVHRLHALYANADTSRDLRELIVASLGDPAWYGRTTDKLATTELAATLGIPIPETTNLADNAIAWDFVHRHGWPVVIKASAGFAGQAVFPCASLRDVRNALQDCPAGSRRLIQRFETGTTWMTSFVARSGEMLAGLIVEKERQNPPSIGPSTIVRCERNVTLHAHAVAMVRALGFSGFGAFDFLRTADGRMLFLEFNPRPTPVCHLGARLGVDLAAAYIDGYPRDGDAAIAGRRVALFPQELRRDPSGVGLAGCWHDIPDDEPELREAMQALIQPVTQSPSPTA